MSSTSQWANRDKIYYWNTLIERVFGNYWFFIVQLSSWEWYHYMQNEILHPAQHPRRTAQVSKRIGTRYTAGTRSLNGFLGTIEFLSFSYPAENGTIRCTMKFCIQHNTLDEQHKSVSESGQNILLEHAHWTGFWELLRFYRSVIQLRMVPLHVEWNFAFSTTH
jgi:hypothetical protein